MHAPSWPERLQRITHPAASGCGGGEVIGQAGDGGASALTPWLTQSAVRGLFNDNKPESANQPRLVCEHPIALHPLKDWRSYLAYAAALDIRDVASDAKLRAWRQQHAARSDVRSRDGS